MPRALSKQNRVISCTLDNFLDKWIDTDAPFPYSTYMQSSGDDVSQGTEWKRDERDVYIASRMAVGIQSYRQLRLSLPPWPRLEIKEQRYRKFGEMTLSIETDKVVLVVQ